MKEILEQIRTAIKDGHPQVTTELVNTALASGVTAKEIVDDGMLSAMKDMSEFFKNGDSDIPRILAAARCIRKGFELIEQDDRLSQQPRIGKVILGTVEGDLHDVGKNLVALMFRSVGFEVIDLGVDISSRRFQSGRGILPECFPAGGSAPGPGHRARCSRCRNCCSRT